MARKTVVKSFPLATLLGLVVALSLATIVSGAHQALDDRAIKNQHRALLESGSGIPKDRFGKHLRQTVNKLRSQERAVIATVGKTTHATFAKGSESQPTTDISSRRRLAETSVTMCGYLAKGMKCSTTTSQSVCTTGQDYKGCAWEASTSTCSTSPTLDRDFQNYTQNPALIRIAASCILIDKSTDKTTACDADSKCEYFNNTCMPTKKTLVSGTNGDEMFASSIYEAFKCATYKTKLSCSGKCAWNEVDDECDFDGGEGLTLECFKSEHFNPMSAPSTDEMCASLKTSAKCDAHSTQSACVADASCKWYTGDPPGTSNSTFHHCEPQGAHADTALKYVVAHAGNIFAHEYKHDDRCARLSKSTCNDDTHCIYDFEEQKCGVFYPTVFSGDTHDPTFRSYAKAEIASDCKRHKDSVESCKAQESCDYDAADGCLLSDAHQAAALQCVCPGIVDHFPNETIANLSSARYCSTIAGASYNSDGSRAYWSMTHVAAASLAAVLIALM